MIDCFTDYSLLGSMLRIEDLVKHAKEKGYKTLGIADFNAGGLLEFYLECKKAEIKPILGLRFYITSKADETTDSQVVLYAQNENGYRALLKLFSRSSVEGYRDGQANLLVDWIPELKDNLVCVLPIGESPNEACSENGKQCISVLRQAFKGKFFFGLYNRATGFDDIWLEKAAKNNVSFLPLSGVRYFKSEDRVAYRVMRAIREKTTVDRLFEPLWMDYSVEMFERQMTTYKHQDYLDKFLNLIDIDIPTPGLKVPRLEIPAPFTSSYDYLIHLCREGYKAKKDEFEAKVVSERMAIELDVIKRCNLADYFLMVYDICKYCDQNNIPRNLGRGSCSGCLITYFLGISKTNALEYGLLFERFLNEDRTQPVEHNGEQYLTDAPDIDLDVSMSHRQKVIEYLREKYGNVAKIGTYTTLSAKACIKDTIRSFGLPESEAAYAASHIEMMFGKVDSLEDTYKKSEKFKDWADAHLEIYKIAIQLEGLKKNASVHAAGIIVSNEPIESRSPIFLANSTGDEFKRDTCSAYDLDFAAKAGLLKMDILGIRSLDVLDGATKLIAFSNPSSNVESPIHSQWKAFLEKNL